jgi:hypothetical protein
MPWPPGSSRTSTSTSTRSWSLPASVSSANRQFISTARPDSTLPNADQLPPSVARSYYYLAFKAKADNFRTFEVVGIVAYWCVPPGPVEEYAGALSLPPAAPYIARCWFIPLLKSMGSGLDGLINAVGFVLLWLCTLSAIHVQIVLSHSAVSDEDKGMYESFVVRQLRTTQDVACPESISVRLPRPPTSLHLPVREP